MDWNHVGEKMSYLRYEALDRKTATAKTDRWAVVNVAVGVRLGVIEWYSHWRKYTFSPYQDVTFDPSCLREIAEFCEKETHRRKSI